MPLSTADQLVIEQIRKRIDFEYQAAIAGIGQLEAILARDSEDSNGARSAIQAFAKRGPLRELVLSQIVGAFASVKEIAEKTGLSETRIRGVLYSPQVMKYLEPDRVSTNRHRFKISAENFARHFGKKKRRAPVRDV